MNKFIDKLKEQLKKHGYKLTTQRRAVLNVLLENNKKHLSTEEIYQEVKKKYPEIGLATVYRTLLLFEQFGIVCKLDFDDGYNRYELNKNEDNHRHHHLICMRCGKVLEVEEDLLENLEEDILKKNKFLVKDHRVKFYGYCEECRKEIGENI